MEQQLPNQETAGQPVTGEQLAAPETAAKTPGPAPAESAPAPAGPAQGDQAPAAAPAAPAAADPNNPAAAEDVDVIEKEWVDRTEQVIKQTAGDPHAEEEAVEDLQIDYLKKRYGKDIKKG